VTDNTAQYSVMKNHVAVFEDVAPPPYVDTRPYPAPATTETNLGLVLTLANLMVSAIIVVAMMLDGAQAKNAIVYGSQYFAVTMAGFALVVTGALSSIVNGWQHEATERRRIDAYQALGEQSLEWRLAVEETRQLELLGRRGSAEGVQRISPLQSYVAPYGDGEQAQVEGVRFAMSLYDTHGRPDARQVHADGRLRGKMLGSKRGAGSRDAGRWLLRAGVVRRVRGGYALAIDKYPTRDTLRHLL
jgi:hypothetical protein